MMRTDLVGGEDILAKIESLREQHDEAHRARADAAEALKDAKQQDIGAGAEALRTGSKPPDPTEPEAQRALAEAERHVEVVRLALDRERAALHADIAQRSDAIRAALARAEDEADEAILAAAAQIEDLLHERADVRAHLAWLDDPSRAIGRRSVQGLDALSGLRAQLGDEPGSATSKHQARLDHEARVDAWNALVQRAKATVSASKLVPVVDPYSDSGKTIPALDEAIEREYERMIEDGETPPIPVAAKWVKKLGTAVKPKGQGTGWAREVKSVLTPMPPDTESAEARRSDIERTP